MPLINTPLRAIGAAAMFACLPSPAAAGRGIQIDQYKGSLNLCSLGQSCPGIDVRETDFSGIYVYKEGVVSFGAGLPLSASVSGGIASLGNGSWFAPGFGDQSLQATFHDPSFNFGFPLFFVTFYAAGEDLGRLSDDREGQLAITPLFQLQYEAPEESSYKVFFAYGDFALGPALGNVIAYSADGKSESVVRSARLLLKDQGTNFELPFTDTGGDNFALRSAPNFQLTYAAVTPSVPEPGIWLTMLGGMSLIGGMMRRQRACRIRMI